MANMPDFSYKQQVDPVSIASILQRKSEVEAAQKVAKEDKTYNRIQDTARLAGQLVSNAVAGAAARQKDHLVTNYLQILGKSPVAPEQVSGPTMDNQPLMNNEAVKADSEKRKAASLGIAKLLAPKELGEAQVRAAFPEAQRQLSGNTEFLDKIDPVTNQVYSVRVDKNQPGKAFTLDGKEIPVDVAGRLVKYLAPALGVDPATQRATVTQRAPGAQPQFLESPSGASQGSTGTQLPYAKRALKEKSEISGTVKELRADPVFSSAELVLNTVGNFKSVLNQDLAVSKGAIKGLAARVLAGEKGVMTDKDVDRQLGQDVANRFNALIRGAVDGRITDQDFRELQSIIQMTVDRASEQYTLAQAQNMESLRTQYGLSEHDVKVMLRYRDPSQVLAVQGQGKVKSVNRAVEKRESAPKKDSPERAKAKAALRSKLGL